MKFLDRFRGKPSFPRRAVFAGRHYPERAEIYTQTADATSPIVPPARAIVIPSTGDDRMRVAVAEGLSALKWCERLALFAPARMVPFSQLAVPNADGWETPAGMFGIDGEGYAPLGPLRVVRVLDSVFDVEPGVEVALPVARAVLGDVALLPFLVGDTASESIERVVEALDDGRTGFAFAVNFSSGEDAERVGNQDRETLYNLLALRADFPRGSSDGRSILTAVTKVAGRAGWQAQAGPWQTLTDDTGRLSAGFGVVYYSEG